MISSAALECRNVNFSYPEKKVLVDFNCKISSGEAVAVLGQSGCGKTSLLRLCAGLAKPASGEILLRGQTMAGKNIFVPASQRRIGFVFQNFALFEKVSVEKNIFYGCKSLDDREEASRLIRMMKLNPHLKKKPYQLSGGEKQKVALARSLALKPDIIFLDEPFSSIDPAQTEYLISEIKDLFSQLRITSIVVTHSHHVSKLFADRTIEMVRGRD